MPSTYPNAIYYRKLVDVPQSEGYVRWEMMYRVGQPPVATWQPHMQFSAPVDAPAWKFFWTVLKSLTAVWWATLREPRCSC